MPHFLIEFENDNYDTYTTHVFKNGKELKMVQSFEFGSSIIDGTSLMLTTVDKIGRERCKKYGQGEFTISYNFKNRMDWNRILNRK